MILSMEFLKTKKFLIVAIILILLPFTLSLIISNFDFGKIFQKEKVKEEPQPKPVVISYTPQPSVAANLQSGPYNCPSTDDFCKNGKDIEKDGKYEGFGAAVPALSSVYAAFEGNISSLKGKLSPELGGEEIVIIYLDNKERGLRAVYTLKGQAPQPRIIKQGAAITRVGDKMQTYGGVSLIFKLIKGDPLLGEVVKLTSEDFK